MIGYILISYLQILFLPGLIFSKLSKIEDLFFIIISSILFNYILIIFLSHFKIYNKENFLLLVYFELFLISILFLFEKKKFIILNLKYSKLDFFLLFIITFFSYYFFKIYSPFLGSIFSEGDVLLSWNEWSYNLLGSTYYPGDIKTNSFDSMFYENQTRSYYSQLIPALWSVFYLLGNNSDLMIFPKILSFLLSLSIFIFLIKSYLKTKNLLYIVIFLSIFYLYFKEHAHFIYSGLVDSPVTILVFISFLFIFKKPEKVESKDIILSILFASTACNIKINAFYYSIFFLNTFIYINFREKFKKNVIYFIILNSILSSFWITYQFLFNEINILTNNNINYLNSLSVKSIPEGFTRFSNLFSSNFVFSLILLSFIFSFFIKKIWIISLFLITPYTIIWYFYSSYDHRNIFIVIPFFCYVLSYQVNYILDKFDHINKKNFINKTFEIQNKIVNKFILIFIFLISIGIFSSSSYLNNKINLKISNSKINLKSFKINNYIIENKNNFDNIYTDYIYLRYALNSNQTKSFNICYLFQKETLDHCKNKPNNRSIFINYYNDRLLNNYINEKYNIELLINHNNIKVYKFIN